MKIRIFILIIMLFCNFLPVFSEEKKSDWGENSDVFNKGFENQKAVSDNKLKNAVKTIKEKQLSKKQMKIRNEVKPLSPVYDSEYLKNFTDNQAVDDDLTNSLTVMIPMTAYSDNGINIQPGYYKLSCRKVSFNEYVLDLSQGNNLIVSVPAKQTSEDLEQNSVSFCNAEVIDNGRIRLMYGTIDLNLVGYLYFK